MGNLVHVGPRTFTENSNNECYLDASNLGVDPEGSYQRHVFQFYNLAGGTVTFEAQGPEGTYAELTSGKGEGDIFALSFPYPRFKLTFIGTGGAGKVSVTSYRTQE